MESSNSLNWSQIESFIIQSKPSNVASIEFIRVVGSHGEGTARDDSDLDLTICTSGNNQMYPFTKSIEIAPKKFLTIDSGYISVDILEKNLESGPIFLCYMNLDGFWIGNGNESLQQKFLEKINIRIDKEKNLLENELKKFNFEDAFTRFQIEMLGKYDGIVSLQKNQSWAYLARINDLVDRFMKHIFYFNAMLTPDSNNLETYLRIKHQELYRTIKFIGKLEENNWIELYETLNSFFKKTPSDDSVKTLTQSLDKLSLRLLGKPVFDGDLTRLDSHLPFVIFP